MRYTTFLIACVTMVLTAMIGPGALMLGVATWLASLLVQS